MLKLNRLLVVMSVERATASAAMNELQHTAFKAFLMEYDLPYDEAVGYYKGTEEKSFVIQCQDFADVGRLQEQAALADQECIMIVDARNKSFLYYPETCHLEQLGYMFQFNRAENPLRDIPDACTILGDEVYYAV